MKGFSALGILTISFLGLVLILSGCGRPDTGLTNGRFLPCPDSPNCVSSMAEGARHAIEPIAYEGRREAAKKAMRTVIQSMKRSRLIADSENYIHAEFRSLIFRFVDDVELFFPEDANVIHMKSASRTGYSDLGVNRKRLEEIRRRFKSITSRSESYDT
ncbi:MAG: DUF1499 domain-containing protein [Desulfobacterales bacterium]|nr:DUF1499 domain-containing protein [Desulfobacterales bacterium]